MEIQGKLSQITDIETIPTKNGNTFQKRNIILDCSRTDEWTGDVYTNILCFEVPQAKVADYDKFKSYEGNIVKIRFAMNGRVVVNGMGESRYFTTLRCLELIPQQASAQTQQPTPNFTQTQQVEQVGLPKQQPIQTEQPQQQGTVDDLPF